MKTKKSPIKEPVVVDVGMDDLTSVFVDSMLETYDKLKDDEIRKLVNDAYKKGKEDGISEARIMMKRGTL